MLDESALLRDRDDTSIGGVPIGDPTQLGHHSLAAQTTRSLRATEELTPSGNAQANEAPPLMGYRSNRCLEGL
jgi:hypothetical protein